MVNVLYLLNFNIVRTISKRKNTTEGKLLPPRISAPGDLEADSGVRSRRNPFPLTLEFNILYSK